jgi:hypothetical protein
MNGSKEYLEELQQEFVGQMLAYDNGDNDVLETLLYLEDFKKPLEECLTVIKEFKDQYIQQIEVSAMDYKDGYNGFDISIRNGGRVFNYKEVEEWQTYEKAKKDCEERLKLAFLSVEAGNLGVTKDGEEIELPSIVNRKSSVSIKLRK